MPLRIFPAIAHFAHRKKKSNMISYWPQQERSDETPRPWLGAMDGPGWVFSQSESDTPTMSVRVI